MTRAFSRWRHVASAVLALLGAVGVDPPAQEMASPDHAGAKTPRYRPAPPESGEAIATPAGASPRLRYLGQFTPHPYPTPSEDVLFKQDFDSALTVERSGCRRSSGPTATYLDASVAKAALVDGYFTSAICNTGPDAGVVVPQDGIVASDEFTVVTKIGDYSTADFTAAPFPGPQTLVVLAGIALSLNPASSLTAVDFYTGQVCTLTPPQWPRATWHTVTLWWRRDPPAMELMLDDDYAGRAVSAPPRTPWDGRPFSGRDDGLAIVASPNPHSFHVSDTTIYRWWRTYEGHDLKYGPMVAVDADVDQGAWVPSLGGCLALYEGFGKTPEGPPQSLIRDQQFHLVFDEARVRSVRVGGLMDMPTITGACPD